MASKQTRRSISISGAMYVRLKAYCLEHDRSMSGFVEQVLRSSLSDVPAAGAKVVAWDGDAPRAPQSDASRPPSLKQQRGNPQGRGFTF